MIYSTNFKNREISLRIRGRLLVYKRPLVMGIINLTPDSFYPDSRASDIQAAVDKAAEMFASGADIIDLGGQSTRPGSGRVDESIENERVLPVVKAIIKAHPEAILSIDSWYGSVAKNCLDEGASMVNDVTAGLGDPAMLAIAAGAKVPMVIMHMKGSPETMQVNPTYTDVTDEVFGFLEQRLRAAKEAGVHDVIVDPGFGFGKTLVHNLELARRFEEFSIMGVPVLAGVSRKKMLSTLVDRNTQEVLPATTALHMWLLERGASVLRVHDVSDAVQCVRMFVALQDCE